MKRKSWICPHCGEWHQCIQFACSKCEKCSPGEITNIRFVEREKGIKEFIDATWRCQKCDYPKMECKCDE